MSLANYWICPKCDARNHPGMRVCARLGCGCDRESWEQYQDFPACEVEAQLHYDIIDECKTRGWKYFHGSMAHKTRRKKGEPDFIILCDKGRVLLVECKDRDGKMSVAQNEVLAHARKLGHTIHVVRSIEQFKDIAKDL